MLSNAIYVMMPEERISKLIIQWTPQDRRKRRYIKKLDGRSTSSHDNEKFRTRSVGKQGGMAFGFRKRATAVIKPDGWMDGWMDGWVDGWVDGWMDVYLCYETSNGKINDFGPKGSRH